MEVILAILLTIILAIMVAIIVLWIVALVKNDRKNKIKVNSPKISIDNHSDSTPDEDIINSKENGYEPKNC